MSSAQTAMLLELPVGPVPADGAARALQTVMARFTDGPEHRQRWADVLRVLEDLDPASAREQPAHSPGACSDGVLDASHRRSSACWTASLSWQPAPT
ncbi:hypothetical protein [Jatrophihabitans lederbergiae]|uniref:Uncharacterized protein n=1 Tax=Jatrophihabitans lederbergiae TaxID=3075547 RepID=A0ABU2JAP7_9ACTN|nr:hypothetical protein [Jatrophihabitans sp. DSM 44399]MDT0262061.1 hypothetical protein [Jatrophihabitans sp. DSM 44399]